MSEIYFLVIFSPLSKLLENAIVRHSSLVLVS